MNVLKLQVFKKNYVFVQCFYNILRRQRYLPSIGTYTTTVDVVDVLMLNQKEKLQNRLIFASNLSMPKFTKLDSKTTHASTMSDGELDKTIQQLIIKNRDKQIEQVILECHDMRKLISYGSLKNMLKYFADHGKPEMIIVLKRYFSKVIPSAYQRNGEFNHYLAKAHCLRGNSERGLLLLKEIYSSHENLRSLYRILFRELIHDSVLNRSEASLVVFKKYVLEFSDLWEENYPLVCFWHICWLSSWYSDHILSNELWDTSSKLRDIVGDKASSLSISALRVHYNEDAVVRLLQKLLKYKMLTEYTKALQVLFDFKLRNRDLRGCSEILRNCDVLGITLPSDQQEKFIRMLISNTNNKSSQQPPKYSNNFKLKF